MPPSRLLRLLTWLLLPISMIASGHSADGAAQTGHPANAATSFIPYLHADGRFGFVDARGQTPFPKTFEDAQPFTEGRAAVKSDGKWGYIDLRGRWIVRPRFTEARPFRDGEAWAAIVKPSTRRGFVDLNPLHSAGSRKCYLISPDGHTRSCGGDYPDRYDVASRHIREPSPDSRKLRVVRAPDGKSIGVLGDDGGQIVPFGIYDDLRYRSDNLFVVHRAGGWGILDAARNVEVVTADRPSFEYLAYTSPYLPRRLLAVRRDDGTRCLLDHAGAELHCGLGDVSHWGESLIAVSNGQKQWGALDTRGQPVIPFRYEGEFRFRDGLARVRTGGREFYIDLQGREYRASSGRTDGTSNKSDIRDNETALDHGTRSTSPASIRWLETGASTPLPAIVGQQKNP